MIAVVQTHPIVATLVFGVARTVHIHLFNAFRGATFALVWTVAQAYMTVAYNKRAIAVIPFRVIFANAWLKKHAESVFNIEIKVQKYKMRFFS